MKNQQKKYKKFILLKKYVEDYEEEMNDDDSQQYQVLRNKYSKLRETQLSKENKLLENKLPSDQKEEQTLHDIISELKEEYFSDLNPEEIPNSDISDISESELVQESHDIADAL